jgi:phage baseplate assembly protein W
VKFEIDFFSQSLGRDITVKVPLEIKSGEYGYDTIDEENIKEAIEYDMKSVIFTSKGERFDRNFGVGIRNVLFESYGSPAIAGLESEIRRQLGTYLPWLSQYNVQVIERQEKNALFVDIKYKINEPEIIGHFSLSVALDRL